MRALVRMSVLFVIAALTLAACSGGGSPSTAASAPASAGTESTAPSEGAPSVEASTEPSVAPSNGGTAAGVCELVTVEELAGIFGVASVSTTVIAGPPDNCIVESDTGDGLAAWSLNTAQASVLFDALTSDPSTVDVSGIGDRAAIVQNTGLLVLKGSSLLVISIAAGANLSEDEGIEAAKAIGTFAAGRL